MTRKTLTSILIILVALGSLACARKEGTAAAAGETPTVKAPEPREEPTTTSELTQTVNLEDGRSESDGGVLTNPNPPIRGARSAPTTTATSTATTTTTATATTTR